MAAVGVLVVVAAITGMLTIARKEEVALSEDQVRSSRKFSPEVIPSNQHKASSV